LLRSASPSPLSSLCAPGSSAGLIYAQGFIQRRSVEIHMDKVESVDVDQSVLGRMLDYGTVIVRGTRATLEPFRDIDRPIDFRN